MTLRAATVLTSPVRSVCLVVGSLIRSQSIIAFSMSNELTHATCEVQPTICTPAKVACCSFYNSILVWLQGEASGEGLSRPLSRDDGMLHRLLAFPCSRLRHLCPYWPMSAPAPTPGGLSQSPPWLSVCPSPQPSLCQRIRMLV